MHGYNFKVISNESQIKSVTEHDIYIGWNRHLRQDYICKRLEKVGGQVIIFENPYIKIKDNQKWFSIGLNWHNNIEKSLPCIDTGERWKNFNVEIKPWRKSGKYYLVATQAKIWNKRGLGHKNFWQPENWDSNTVVKLKQTTHKPIIFRQHPNGKERGRNNKHPRYIKISDGSIVPLEKDLEQAFASVVYSSNLATDSLLQGVPVFYNGKNLYLKDACKYGFEDFNNPVYPNNRENLFQRMAWNQFSLEEIQNGFMLDILLQFKMRKFKDNVIS